MDCFAGIASLGFTAWREYHLLYSHPGKTGHFYFAQNRAFLLLRGQELDFA